MANLKKALEIYLELEPEYRRLCDEGHTRLEDSPEAEFIHYMYVAWHRLDGAVAHIYDARRALRQYQKGKK